jgi:hypothetical protein
MKKLTFILIVFSIAALANAQNLLDTYFKRIPELPRDTCNISKAAAESFELQVSALVHELADEILNENRMSKEFAKKNSASMQDNTIKQMQQVSGMSDEDINKMKNAKNMSKEERMAMVNNMMQQGTIPVPVAQANTKQQTTSSNVNNLMGLQKEHQDLINKIKTEEVRIAGLYTQLDNDPSGNPMKEKIAKWSREYNAMGEIIDTDKQVKQAKALLKLIRDEETSYCNLLTPKYRAVLLKHLASLKASLPDHQRASEITSEINKVQTGVAIPLECLNIDGLRAMQSYLGKLADAYKYKKFYPENN